MDTLTMSVNVRGSGAVGDGETDDRAAIQDAIDNAHVDGGGTVYLPAGTYLTGSIHLKSNVTLHIGEGAVLLGQPVKEAYDVPHLIYAEDQENIAVVGLGTIDGQGEAFWVREGHQWRVGEWRPGRLMQFDGCKRILIRDVKIINSPGWTIRPLRCDNVTISGITILNDPWGPNTDGIDPDCSTNVHISDCHIVAGDDCIVIKSLEPYPCENITVTNCTLETTCAALKLGTETHADIRHCVFSNCTIRNTSAAITIFAKDGGNLENVLFSNISIETASEGKYQGREWPIFIDLERRNPDSAQSAIRDVLFRDITVQTSGRSVIQGMKNQPLERVTFDNVTVRVKGYDDLEGLGKPRGGRTSWQDPDSGDNAAAPAHFAATYVKGLTFRNVTVVVDEGIEEQPRSALYCETCEDVRIDGLSTRQSGQGKAAIHLRDTTRAAVSNCRARPGTGTFLNVEGAESKGITLTGNDLSDASLSVEAEGVDIYQGFNRER